MSLRWKLLALLLLGMLAMAIAVVSSLASGTARGAYGVAYFGFGGILLIAAALVIAEARVWRPLARLDRRMGPGARGVAVPGDPIATVEATLAALERDLAATLVDARRAETDRAQADAGRRLADERLALAVRSANDGLWEWNLASGQMELSPRWKAMLGYADHEVDATREAWRRCVVADDLPLVDTAVDAHLQGRSERFELQYRVRHRDGGVRWILSRGAAIRHANGKPYRMIGLDTDVTAVKRVEFILQEVVEGTAGASGAAFFRSLVRHLARALKAPCAFVTECVDYPTSRLRTLAFWSDEGFLDNFEYALSGTPCEAVVQGGTTCFHPRGVGTAFPAEAGYEGYVGVPILDDRRRVLGHLAILDRKAMGDDVLIEAVFRIFTARAAAELARMRTQEWVLRVVDSLAGLAGEACLAALVKSFAELMDVREAIVTECLDAPQRRLRVLAWWRDGKHEPEVEYDLAGSTCEETIEAGRLCFFAQGVSERFPPARPLGRASYLGVPCFGAAGKVIGHVACFDDRPIERALPDEAVLRLFAKRAAVEIERRQITGADGGASPVDT